MIFPKVSSFNGVFKELTYMSYNSRLAQTGMGLVSHPLISNMFLLLRPEDKVPLGLETQPFGTDGKKALIVDDSVATDTNKTRLVIEFLLERFKEFSHGKIETLFMLVNKPYRLHLFALSWRYLDEKTYNTLLRDLWITTEFPIQHPGEVEVFTELWKMTSFEYLYPDKEDQDDKTVHANLETPIKIYRGLQSNKAKAKSLSWTLSYDVAHWFANRWNGAKKKSTLDKYKAKTKEGVIYEAEIAWEDIFIYTNARFEDEVIVNPFKLKKLKKIKWDGK